MRTWVIFLFAVLMLGPGMPAAVHAEVGVPFDLQGFVDQAVKAGNKRIVVPPGKYRVTPGKNGHLLLRNLHDVALIAAGVELICTETSVALTVDRCTNVTVSGLTIDYDPLPFTQGRITAMSADKSEHTIELFDGYPAAETVQNFKYEIFRPDTRMLRCDSYYPNSVQVIDSRHIRVNKGAGNAADPEQLGDIIAIASNYAPHGNGAHAVILSYCKSVELTNITLFASNCFGFIETECAGSIYRGCRIDRCPPERDLRQRASPRIRSLDADAFHSIGAAKGPAIIGCTARFMGDDAVNIHGAYSMVVAANGTSLRVLENGAPLRVGEPVELWNYDGVRLPDARVISVSPAGEITPAERAFVLQQRMDEGIRRTGLTKACTLTLDRAVDLPMGALLCSTLRMGNGFQVKDCAFGYNRSRGILIKASDGEVSGNIITGSWMAAILVSPEYWWLEAGSSSNVRITDNIITDCVRPPLVVEAVGGSGKVAPPGAHRNIVITGNQIIHCPLPNIRVTSIDGLTLEGNHFEQARAGALATSHDSVQMEQCDHVRGSDSSSGPPGSGK